MDCQEVTRIFKEKMVYFPEAEEVMRHILDCSSGSCRKIKTGTLIFYEAVAHQRRGENNLSKNVAYEGAKKVAETI